MEVALFIREKPCTMVHVSGVQKKVESKRGKSATPERRNVLILLIVATVVAVACAVFPSVWMARVGTLIALVAAWVSTDLALREVNSLREAHFVELRDMRHQSAEMERRHHAESMEMIDTFAQRVGALSETLATTRSKLDRAENEMMTLRGDKAALQYKVAEGNKRVRELQERIVALETQLDTEMAKAFEGSHARTVTDAGVPTAGDIWPASNDSTIVDLSRVAFPNLDEDDVAERRQA